MNWVSKYKTSKDVEKKEDSKKSMEKKSNY